MIGIITVFYSENYGSVLQSFALRKYIEKKGKTAVYIDTRNRYSSHSIKNTCMSIIYKLLHFDIYNARLMFYKYKNFNNKLSNVPFISYCNVEKEGVDLLIVGSDTVWDVKSKYFNESKDLFWPQNENIKIISYAASIANSTVEDMKSLRYPTSCINKLSGISVRDSHSYRTVKELTNKEIFTVCDPTLLLEEDDYKEFFVPIADRNYVAVYLFENLDKDVIGEIVKWSRTKHLKIISLCKKLDWCDSTVLPSIENFISYIKNAEFVITNTFHGTIFSIIFNKQFICLGKEKKKISEFLSMLNLGDRMYDENQFNIMFDCNVNYDEVKTKLSVMKQESIDFLEKYI